MKALYKMYTQEQYKTAIESASISFSPAVYTGFSTVLTILGVTINPAIPYLFASAYGLFGFYLCFKQDKINQFAKWISENPNEFTKEIVSQPAFEDGFIATLEAYLRSRNQEKTKMVQSVFLGFASSKEKEKFQLERLYRTISSISVEGLEYLRFIASDIIDDYEKHIISEMKRCAWDRDMTESSYPLTKFIENWIHENFDPNSKKVKDIWGYHEDDFEMLTAIYEKKRPQEILLRESISEFISLGIFKGKESVGGTIGGGGTRTQYSFTKFGKNFFQYLQKIVDNESKE